MKKHIHVRYLDIHMCIIYNYMQFAFLHMGNGVSICANSENADMLMLETSTRSYYSCSPSSRHLLALYYLSILRITAKFTGAIVESLSCLDHFDHCLLVLFLFGSAWKRTAMWNILSWATYVWGYVYSAHPVYLYEINTYFPSKASSQHLHEIVSMAKASR